MADQTSNSANGNPGTPGNSPSPVLGTASNPGTATQPQHSSLGEARSHLGRAASAAGDSLRGAGRAAREELRAGSDGVRSELEELGTASRAAAYEARDLADQKLQEAMARGGELLSGAERMIREKPLQAIGIAALAGYLLAKLRG